MILGLDYGGVLDKRSVAFVELATAILAAGGKVYIISAVEPGNEAKTARAIARCGITYTDSSILTYENFHDAPKLKFQECSLLGVELFIDDRKDTVNYLMKRGITSLLFVPK